MLKQVIWLHQIAWELLWSGVGVGEGVQHHVIKDGIQLLVLRVAIPMVSCDLRNSLFAHSYMVSTGISLIKGDVGAHYAGLVS